MPQPLHRNNSQNNHQHILKSIDNFNIKYKAPVILRMYGMLNKLDLINENRYILCNFLDQYSDILKLKNDIYIENNKKSLNQLFLMAYRKAKENNLLNELYQGYLDSIKAISRKSKMTIISEDNEDIISY